MGIYGYFNILFTTLTVTAEALAEDTALAGYG